MSWSEVAHMTEEKHRQTIIKRAESVLERLRGYPTLTSFEMESCLLAQDILGYISIMEQVGDTRSYNEKFLECVFKIADKYCGKAEEDASRI